MTRGVVCSVVLVFSLTALIRAIIHMTDYRQTSQINALKLPSRVESDLLVPDSTVDRLFWFIQLSDLHLSQFNDNGRTGDFSRMCRTHIPIISPDIVIISGDITDAKFPRLRGSQQFINEWVAYEKAVKDSGLIGLDNFNVRSIMHPENYFRTHSVDGENFTKSYMYFHRKPFGNYAFIALDACPSPGLKRPFNFFGVITPELMKSLQSFTHHAQGSNQTFWFGHYPTSTIISRGFDLRRFIGETAYCYLCGHLHSLLNVAHKMYTVQPQGFLELELADWRDGRFFRIVAVDNDLVSFVDSQVQGSGSTESDWPVVLITNPKNAAFLLPHKEPTDRIARSTHIRILAWSDSSIARVSVAVDGENLGDAKPVTSKEGKSSPLYVLPWHPRDYLKRGAGEHTIRVVCEDSKGNIRKVQQTFTLDGTTRWNFGGLQSFILLSNHDTNLMVTFYIFWFLPFLLLVTARLFGEKRLYWRICADLCQIEGLWELTADDLMFSSLLCYLLYLLCGPIFMGFLLDDTFGFVFTFGVVAQGIYIPEGTTYLVECIQARVGFIGNDVRSVDFDNKVNGLFFPQLVIFVYPLMLLLMFRARRGTRRCFCCRCACSHSRICDKVVMSMLTVGQLIFAVVEVLLPYGWLSFVLSPGRLWLLPFGWYLFVRSGRIKGHILRVWEFYDTSVKVTEKNYQTTEESDD